MSQTDSQILVSREVRTSSKVQCYFSIRKRWYFSIKLGIHQIEHRL